MGIIKTSVFVEAILSWGRADPDENTGCRMLIGAKSAEKHVHRGGDCEGWQVLLSSETDQRRKDRENNIWAETWEREGGELYRQAGRSILGSGKKKLKGTRWDYTWVLGWHDLVYFHRIMLVVGFRIDRRGQWWTQEDQLWGSCDDPCKRLGWPGIRL